MIHETWHEKTREAREVKVRRLYHRTQQILSLKPHRLRGDTISSLHAIHNDQPVLMQPHQTLHIIIHNLPVLQNDGLRRGAGHFGNGVGSLLLRFHFEFLAVTDVFGVDGQTDQGRLAFDQEDLVGKRCELGLLQLRYACHVVAGRVLRKGQR